MSHDRTPWTRNYQCILDADGRVLASFEEGGPKKGERATYKNAARAVACVNACEGMDDPAAGLAEARLRVAAVARLLPYIEAVCDSAGKRDTAAAVRDVGADLRVVLTILGGGK